MDEKKTFTQIRSVMEVSEEMSEKQKKKLFNIASQFELPKSSFSAKQLKNREKTIIKKDIVYN